MAGEEGVGAIGARDSLRWVPSDNILTKRRHNLVCFHFELVHIVARIRV